MTKGFLENFSKNIKIIVVQRFDVSNIIFKARVKNIEVMNFNKWKNKINIFCACYMNNFARMEYACMFKDGWPSLIISISQMTLEFGSAPFEYQNVVN